VVKQARSIYLFKAIQNILGFKSMVQSIIVLDPIIRRIQDDQIEYDMDDVEEVKDNMPSTTKPLV